MANEELRGALRSTKAFFDKTIECFKEADSAFAPRAGMFTVAQHVAHAAQTIEWFLEGAFRPQGMNTGFEALALDVRKIDSLQDARTWWNDAMAEALESLADAAPESWAEPIRGPLMAGQPRSSIVGGIVDHSAHHRGALAVYARLCGRTPAMPYA